MDMARLTKADSVYRMSLHKSKHSIKYDCQFD